MSSKRKTAAALIAAILAAMFLITCVFGADNTTSNTAYVTKINIVSIQQTNRSVMLKWKPISGAVKYIIHRTSRNYDGTEMEKGFTEYSTTKQEITDTNHLSRNRIYIYSIFAYNKSGKIIAMGQQNIIKIDTPSIISAASTTGKINIRWKKNENADRYKVQIVKGSNFNLSGVKTFYYDKTKTSADVSGLSSGTSYTLRISAEKSGKASSWSSDNRKITSYSAWAYKKVKTQAVTPVVMKTAFKGWINKDSGITFSWKKANGAEGYKIFRKEGLNGSWKALATVSGNTFSYVDKSAKIGTKYYYSVVGYKKNNNFNYKNGMSETKALVRLTKPEHIWVEKAGSKYFVCIYKNGINNDQKSFDASDRLIVELIGKSGSVKTKTVKKDKLDRYSFDTENTDYVRVRYGKTYNNYLYGGAWSAKINAKIVFPANEAIKAVK